MEAYTIEKECPIPEPFGAMVGNVLFITALFFLTFIGRFIFAPLMPTIEQELGLSHGQAGSLFLIVSLGLFVSAAASGFLSSRINHSGSLMFSAVLMGLGLLACYLAYSLWALRVLMLVLGLAAGLHLPSAIATITAMVNRQDWGKALAVHQTAPPLSLVLGPLLSVALLGFLSWRTILACLGGLTIVVAFVFLRFCKCGGFPGDVPRPAVVKGVVGQGSFWIMVVLFALGMGGSVGIYAMLPLYLVTERGLDSELANTLLGLSQISGLFMAFIAGWITDRVGEKRAIWGVLLLAGAATILLGVASGTWLVVIVFVQPALIVCYFPAGFAALSRIVQPNMRSIAAAFAPPSAFILGGGIFPAAIGYMGQNYTFGLGIILVGCVIIVCSGLVFFLRLIEKMEDGC